MPVVEGIKAAKAGLRATNEVLKNTETDTGKVAAAGGAVAAGIKGAAIGTAVAGPIGTVLGGFVGAGLGAMAGSKVGDAAHHAVTGGKKRD